MDDREVTGKLIKDYLHLRNVEMEKVIRLGKRREDPEAKPRPLMIQMFSVQDKWNVLKQARSLKHCTDATIRKAIIVPDLPREEREKEWKLRSELKRRRENGESGWYIKNGSLKRRQGDNNNNDRNNTN